MPPLPVLRLISYIYFSSRLQDAFDYMMLRLFLLVVTCVWGISYQSEAQSSSKPLTKIYNEEGLLQMTIAYDGSCGCSVFTEFFTDGKVLAKRKFKKENGKHFVIGEDVEYHHNGKIKTYRFWEDARIEGRVYGLHEDGALHYEEFYRDGYKEGTWKYYDAFGKLSQEKIHPARTNTWDEKKDKLTINQYKDGKLVKTQQLNGSQLSIPKETGSKEIPGADNLDEQSIFEKKCKACHGFTDDGYGPALGKVSTLRTRDWQIRMIRNAQDLIDAGDPTAIMLYKQWAPKKHPDFRDKLTEQQILILVKYLDKMSTEKKNIKRK